MISSSHGILVVDKPSGITSAAVVSHVKRTLKIKKVGHTGTLDPMATGVLPLCLGEATKIAGYLLADDKEYIASIRLGLTTDTLDRMGEAMGGDPALAHMVTLGQIKKALAKFSGEIWQVPPMFSALHHKGKRLYQLAREGKNIDIPARQVKIHGIEFLSFENMTIDIRVSCSKGTYVRSLARDIGVELGCGARLEELRRIRSGQFSIDAAIRKSDLNFQGSHIHMIPIVDALVGIEKVAVDTATEVKIKHGKSITCDELGIEFTHSKDTSAIPLALVGPRGGLAALVKRENTGKINYLRVFTYGLTPQSNCRNLPANTSTN